MPLAIVPLEDGGCLLKGSGTLRFEDVCAVNEILYATDESIRALRYQISDYSNVESIEMSSDEVRALAKQDVEASKVNPDMLVAVVGRDDLLYGLLRMWSMLTSLRGFETSVFRDMAEAQEWIAGRLADLSST